MTNFNFAKFKDTPLNRDGETLDENVTLPVLEGDFVGLTTNVDGETRVVPADADSASAQPAIGVQMEDARARSYWSTTLHDNGSMSRKLDEAYAKERTQAGDEVTYFTHGIYLEDEDGTVSFNTNEPVYLDVGGGVTQTKPSAVGDVVQKLGTAVNATTFLLNVEEAYEVVDEDSGEFLGSGDGSTGGQTFSIAHNLGVAPSGYNVEAASADAAGDYYVSATSTSLDVTFPTAPASGTDNVTLNWSAQE